jgi:hypothetical protein
MLRRDVHIGFARHIRPAVEISQALVVSYPLSWDFSSPDSDRVICQCLGDCRAAVSGLGAYAIVRAKSKDVFAFAILFYLVTLSVSSNLFVKIAATFAERLLYTPSLGFCIAVPSSDREAAGRRPRSKDNTSIAVALRH